MYQQLLEKMTNASPALAWPVLPPLGASRMLALLYQFEKAERMPAEWVQAQQFRQINQLVRHASRSCKLYRERFPAEVLEQATPENWLQVPVLTRAELQAADLDVVSGNPPKGHELTGQSSTSGSTGMPVKVFKNKVVQLYWTTNTVREKLWRGWDVSGKLASIRPELNVVPGESMGSSHWGPMAELLPTGPGVGMNIRTPIAQQVAWLASEQPDFLLTLPTNLRALVSAGADLSAMRGLCCYGELLEEDTRKLVQEQSGLFLFDTYSSVDAGYLSMQCSEAGKHHVLSDCVLLEVVDDHDQPCAPGEIGRVVVTVLYNLLAPMIRYELGDYAVAGERCSCGRTFPVLDRILGRSRNMLRLPDGSQHWPSFCEEDWAVGVPLKQYQLVQNSLQQIDVNLVTARQITEAQEQAMRAALQERLLYPFEIAFHYLSEIPRSKGGKFEDFICRVGNAGSG